MSLKTFTVIVKFVDALASVFDERREVLLYHRFLSHVKAIDDIVIDKNISVFRHFCVNNKQAIREKNVLLFVSHRINYAEKIYLNIKLLLDHVSDEPQVQKSIWDHLLKLLHVLDPCEETEIELKKLIGDNSDNPMAGLIGEMFTDMSNVLGDQKDFDLGSAITKLTQSGMLQNMLSKVHDAVNNNTLDPQQVMSSILKGNGNNTDGVMKAAGAMMENLNLGNNK